jgi:hypothetical protein
MTAAINGVRCPDAESPNIDTLLANQDDTAMKDATSQGWHGLSIAGFLLNLNFL